jgi:hypothetical protein
VARAESSPHKRVSAKNAFVGESSYIAVLTAVFVMLAFFAGTAHAHTPSCSAPANEIVAENCQPGNPPSEWDVEGAGDPSIQGFATDISVDQGQTVHFKVDTTASAYRLDIYRMGWYGGTGASQPPCELDDQPGLIDCGNWGESVSWSAAGPTWRIPLIATASRAGGNRPPSPPR